MGSLFAWRSGARGEFEVRDAPVGRPAGRPSGTTGYGRTVSGGDSCVLEFKFPSRIIASKQSMTDRRRARRAPSDADARERKGNVTGLTMDIWGTIFKRRREAEAAAKRMIGAALERGRMPQGPQASANFGASLRAQVIEVVEAVEAQTGKPAFGLAGPEQILMVSPALTAAFRQFPLDKVLEWAFPLMFTTRDAKNKLVNQWPTTVRSFHGQHNDTDVLKRKAGSLSLYILHHYDIAIAVVDKLNREGYNVESGEVVLIHCDRLSKKTLRLS